LTSKTNERDNARELHQLMEPAGWGDLFNIRIKGVDPAVVPLSGKLYGGSCPWFVHLKLEFQYFEVDASHHRIRLKVRFAIRHDGSRGTNCIPLAQDQCRVNYRCEFGSRIGWRGAIARMPMRRQFDAGPIDSARQLASHVGRLV
jgi:hypothetical protein